MRRHGDLRGIYGEAPAAVASAKAYAEKHLEVVAQFINGRDFLLGDRLGLADVMLVSCLDWAVHYGFDLTDSLLRYQAVHHGRDAYGRAYDANYAK
jgi:glutathione S-transferase